MNQLSLDKYRQQIQKLLQALRPDLATIADQTIRTSGGTGSGELTNAPMHPADRGTDEYLQELNATLLENEQYIANECLQALERLQDGSFGKCERCGEPIAQARLTAIPYARLCIGCAEETGAGSDVNLNHGRPA